MNRNDGINGWNFVNDTIESWSSFACAMLKSFNRLFPTSRRQKMPQPSCFPGRAWNTASFWPKNSRRLTSSSRAYLATPDPGSSPRDPYIITICSKNLFKPGFLESISEYPLRMSSKNYLADSALMVAVQLHKTKHISTLVQSSRFWEGFFWVREIQPTQPPTPNTQPSILSLQNSRIWFPSSRPRVGVKAKMSQDWFRINKAKSSEKDE